MRERFENCASPGGIRFYLGEVRDRDRLTMAMRGIDTVIHAAALKIVRSLRPTSWSPTTWCTGACQRARESPLHHAVDRQGGQPDQPVRRHQAGGRAPLHAANSYRSAAGPAFAVVRYGNVAGSRGSVIPASGRETIKRMDLGRESMQHFRPSGQRTAHHRRAGLKHRGNAPGGAPPRGLASVIDSHFPACIPSRSHPGGKQNDYRVLLRVRAHLHRG